MRLIDYRDLQDYSNITKIINRSAVRAIIIKNEKIALIKSRRYGELKFPGGGQESGESDIDTLVRETKEETGLDVITSTIKPYGKTYIKRRSIFNSEEIFAMESRYYVCDVKDEIGNPSLSGYEIDYGYHLVFFDIDEAIQNQKNVLVNGELKDAEYVHRELCVLEDIKINLLKRS